MCGIAGIIVKPNKLISDLPARLSAMERVMHHRGPDDGGIYISANGRFSLTNRRLAIRDLSAAGHMPMKAANSHIHISYNGEIYNADSLRSKCEAAGLTFHSSSDTEVILNGYALWGNAIVPQLRGQFAFAIYDERPHRSPRLLLARDQLGIKPLYYAQTENSFLFASELKTLHAANLTSKNINPLALNGYLQLGSVPNPLTIYADIQAMPPATTISCTLNEINKVQPVTYYQLPENLIDIDHQTAVIELRKRLETAVSNRLISDVPLGAFLSGGLDSSGVVALMRAATGGDIRTCSMVFEEDRYSEADYAQTMARTVNSNHYERTITATDLMDEFDNILAAMDQPSIDGVNSYFVSQTARQAGLTVALSGLGGDELFGGYANSFQQAPRLAQMARWVQAIPGGTALAQSALQLPSNRQQFQRVREALPQPNSLAAAYVARRGLYTATETAVLLQPSYWQSFNTVAHLTMEQAGIPPTTPIFGRSPTAFSWISRAELRSYTHQQLLRDTDVMSMAHSLEVRVPLLDIELVEFALRLPTAVKTKQVPPYAIPKPLFAAALDDILPRTISQRRQKQGFTFPFDVWLRGPLRERSHTMVHAVSKAGWIQESAATNLLTNFENGSLHWSRLWAVMVLAAFIS